MAEHKIKIGADFRNVTQGFKNLSDSITELSKRKPKLGFDDSEFKKMLDGMSRDIDNHQDKIEKRVGRLSTISTRVYRDLQKAYEDSTDPRRIEQLQRRYDNLNKTLADNVRQLKTLHQSQQALTAARPTAPTGFLGRIGRAFPGRIPMPGGMLGRAARFLGPAGMAMGAGVAGLGALYGMGAARREIVGEGLQLRAFQPRTAADIERIRETGIRTGLGYTPMESIRQAVQLERAIGVGAGRQFGGRTALERAQRLGRGFGVEVEQIAGMAGQLRRAGLREDESLRKLRDIFIQGTALGVERARLPEFAQAQIGYLEQQSAQGEVSIKGLEGINALLSRNRFFADDPRRGINIVQGLERGFGQQQGPGALAAFQTIQQITGGVSPIQAIGMKRRGFLRTMERFAEEGKIEDINKGIEIFLNNIGKLKLGRDIDVNKLEEGTDEFVFMATALQDVMGIDITLAEQMLTALKGDEEVTEKWLEGKMKAAKKSKNILERVMRSQDMQIQKLEAALQEFKIDTGDIANAITAGLHQFASNILESFKESLEEMLSPGVSGVMARAKRRVREEIVPAADGILEASSGNIDLAIKEQKKVVEEAEQSFRETGRSFADIIPIPGIEGEREEAREELAKEMQVLKQLEVWKEQKRELTTRLDGTRKQEEIGEAKFDPTREQNILRRANQEQTQISSEEQEKIRGRKPAHAGAGSDDTTTEAKEFGRTPTIPGTNILVTPMNRLRDSIDRLTDTVERSDLGGIRGGKKRRIKENTRVR